ncbi:EAL domain-containing protein [Proteobacteria bacterium 005FR1]|nr:EAL domain-containing protein [Proteobacteria bacterium 005FR1]
MTELCLRETDYQSVFHSSRNAYVLLTPDLIVIDANAAYLELFTLRKQDLIGRQLLEIFPPKENHAAQQVVASLERVLQTGAPDTLSLVHYPVARQNAAGLEWEDRYWTVNNSPVLTGDGRIAAILSHNMDVTRLLSTRESQPDTILAAHSASQLNEALYAERRRLRQLMDQAPGFVAVGRGANHVIELANRAYYQLVGHREILGKPVRDALPELEDQGFFELLDQVYQSGKPFIGRAMPIFVQHEPGAAPTQRFIDFIYQPIVEQDGSISGIFVQGHDVTETHELSQQVAWQAAHDSLTGLCNRREFELQVVQAIDALSGDGCHSLLYMDLDQFKLVNDSCGHSAGDALLCHIAALLGTRIRPGDTFARLGGDEFGLLLRGCPAATAERIANELREQVSGTEFAWDQRIFGCSVSIGVVTFSEGIHGLDNLLSAADSACFLAKEKGRNRVQVYRPEDDELITRRREMDWVGRLRGALQENRILLYAQRIEPLGIDETGCDRMEILIRLQETDGSLVPPAAFIPAAERFGLMPAIDRYVVKSAFEFLHQLSPPERRHTAFSINLSGATLCDEEFPGYVEALLRQVKVAPQQICFEITETAAVANLAQAGALIAEIRKLGFHFALDDFGRGMSSFTYLKHLPVDALKIDGAFVRNIIDDEIDATMVRAIVQIAAVMKLQTVAEYVENDLTREVVRKIGVNYAQGFGIHKPEPLSAAKEYAESLRRRALSSI